MDCPSIFKSSCSSDDGTPRWWQAMRVVVVATPPPPPVWTVTKYGMCIFRVRTTWILLFGHRGNRKSPKKPILVYKTHLLSFLIVISIPFRRNSFGLARANCPGRYRTPIAGNFIISQSLARRQWRLWCHHLGNATRTSQLGSYRCIDECDSHTNIYPQCRRGSGTIRRQVSTMECRIRCRIRSRIGKTFDCIVSSTVVIAHAQRSERGCQCRLRRTRTSRTNTQLCHYRNTSSRPERWRPIRSHSRSTRKGESQSLSKLKKKEKQSFLALSNIELVVPTIEGVFTSWLVVWHGAKWYLY